MTEGNGLVRATVRAARKLRGTAQSFAAAACAAAALACLSPAAAPAQTPWRWPAASKVVAVPDVHGAYAELVALLEATGLVDESLEWTGGDAVLVSLGDLLDRGAESRRVMDLLMRLQRTAPAAGGAVHVVLGNHEAMNLMGDLRYVAPEEYAAFAADETPETRERAYAEFVRAQTEARPEAELRAEFAERYPPGFFAHREAFAPDGAYGSWLLGLPAVIVIGETVFTHGGLSASVSEDVNARVRSALREYLALRTELAGGALLDPAGDDPEASNETLRRLAFGPELGSESPLWYRGSAYCNPALERPVLGAALARLGAERVVVGHTPTADRRARALHDGRLIMLDTGMLAEYYSGRPAALVIEPVDTFVQYAAPAERRPLAEGRLEAYGLTEEELRTVLVGGAIEPADAERAGDAGAVIVRQGDAAVRALLHRDDAADAELAAHALDRRLGLGLVPITVGRTVGAGPGALQVQYADAVTEAERVEQRVPLGEFCALEPQWQLMFAFDALIGNAGRSADNLLYRRETSVLKLTGHAQAFGTERRVRVPEGFVLPAALRPALDGLGEDAVRAAVGDRLTERQIRALLARRDALLESAARD